MTSGRAAVRDVLVDTDVCIDHLEDGIALPEGPALWCSVITRAELFAGKGEREQVVQTFLDGLRQIDVDKAIAERAGRLRRRVRRLRLPDALIAATAIEHDLVLHSRNRVDFRRVPDLELFR